MNGSYLKDVDKPTRFHKDLDASQIVRLGTIPTHGSICSIPCRSTETKVPNPRSAHQSRLGSIYTLDVRTISLLANSIFAGSRAACSNQTRSQAMATEVVTLRTRDEVQKSEHDAVGVLKSVLNLVAEQSGFNGAYWGHESGANIIWLFVEWESIAAHVSFQGQEYCITKIFGLPSC